MQRWILGSGLQKYWIAEAVHFAIQWSYSAYQVIVTKHLQSKINNPVYFCFRKTGLCQKKQRDLLVAISKARDYGLVSFDVPIREYDYSDYHVK